MIATMIWLLTGGANRDNNNGTKQIAKQQEIAKQSEKDKNAKNDGAKGNGTPKTIPTVPPLNQNGAQTQQGNSKSSNASPVIDNRKKVLMLLPQDDLFYPDYNQVRLGLPQRSVKLVTASMRKEPVRFHPEGRGPEPITADEVISSKLKAKDFDALIFVGGRAPELCTGTAGPEVKRLLNEFQAASKPIAALCAGQHVPAYHSIFKAGTRVAGGQYVDEHPDFKNCGATVVKSENVVIDPKHRLITGQEAPHGGQLAGELARMIGANYP